jgi:hypothetical protein
MFFELRSYRVSLGKRDEWVRLIEEKIITPGQTAMGAVIIGSFVGIKEGDRYVVIAGDVVSRSEVCLFPRYASVWKAFGKSESAAASLAASVPRQRSIVRLPARTRTR